MTNQTRQVVPLHAAAIRVLLAITLTAVCALNVDAQTKKVAPRKAKPPEPKFDDITLVTRDGVELRCTYYPGPETKQTPAMILLHDWGENRGVMHPIALWMQKALKVSVIAPDLRGHGNSTTARGYDDPIDPDRLKGNAVDAMTMDIEACKSYLVRQNNEGKLNIEQLGILGSGFGGCLALKWSIQDWRYPNLGTMKQGRDVKALILISPSRAFRGTTINTELKQLAILRNISIQIIVGGEDTRSMSEAKRIHKSFERAWGDDEKDQAVPFLSADTSLQKTDLLKSRGTGVDRWMGTFINRRLIQLGDRLPWSDRTSPLK